MHRFSSKIIPMILLTFSCISMGQEPAKESTGINPQEGQSTGLIRITAPGGLVLHRIIPEGKTFESPLRFQITGPRKGMNNSDLHVNGEISMGPKGHPVFRGQCMQSDMVRTGKMFVPRKSSTPFGGSLEHGRHTAVACPGVLVSVTLPQVQD